MIRARCSIPTRRRGWLPACRLLLRAGVLRRLAVIVVLLTLASVAARASSRVVVDNWSASGPRGVPSGWQAQSWGKRADYDLEIVRDGAVRALHLRSRGERSTITRDLRGQLDLRETPVLEWSWKVVTLPAGGDARRKETTDQAAQIYVTWPRFPEAVRSRILGYAWDSGAPVGSMLRSKKTGTVTYFILRSGPSETGKWVTERRNIVEDFRRAFGEEPPEPPGAVSISIDSNDTRSAAESYIGPIAFVAR